MRLLLLSLVLVLGAQRADLLKPQATDATLRSYEIIGITVNVPVTLFTQATVRANVAGPPRPDLFQWLVAIRYIDNLGTEYSDTHSDNTGAEKVAREVVLAPSSTPLKERLLQHLIAEGKISAARISK